MSPTTEVIFAKSVRLIARTSVVTTFGGARQSARLSPIWECLSKNGDNVGVRRHVGDMSATYLTKTLEALKCTVTWNLFVVQ